MNLKFCNKTIKPISSCSAHMHKYWEIILHLSGNSTSNIKGKIYEIKVGDIAIIPPNTLHDGFSAGIYTDMYLQCEDLDFTDVTILHDHDGSILSLMNLLHKVYTEKENCYKDICDNLLRTIFSYLNKFKDGQTNHGFIDELRNKMYENLSNCDFKISDFVISLGFNMDYVRRCFKEETGMTPLEYITKIRLNYAKKLLLQETYISVVDVSEKCGFNDSFYFSKVFKQNFGISPLNYRKDRR